MIEINLLPHREARRIAEVKRSLGMLAAGLVAVSLAIGLAQSSVTRQAELARASVQQLQGDLVRFKPQQEKLAEFKIKKAALEEKLATIRELDEARKGPVRLLGEVGNQTPDRLWLTQISADGQQVTLEGASLDNSVVADFLRNLNDSPYFSEVDLDKTAREKEIRGVKLVNFTITASLHAAEKDKPKSGV